MEEPDCCEGDGDMIAVNATNLQTMLEAIKESDATGRNSLPKKISRIRQAIGKLR